MPMQPRPRAETVGPVVPSERCSMDDRIQILSVQSTGTVMPVLLVVFSRPVRWCVAGVCLAGTGLAMMSAVLSVTRLGIGKALAFAAVGVVSAAFAVAVLRAARWALWLAVVVCGG